MTSINGNEIQHNLIPEYENNTGDTTTLEVAEYVNGDNLYLSKRKLKYIPNNILKLCNIRVLYLEGNEIRSIPENFFTSLSNLVWLDVRNNEITQLPPNIGQHRCLKTLLLGGNAVHHLPLELGNLISLKALNLRGCPIEFPPQEIVHQGLQSILWFLRSQMVKRPVNVKSTVTEMPCVEKLELTESSLDCSEDAPCEAELQRFEELKERMIEMEKEHYGGKGLSEGSTLPRLQSHKMQYWERPEDRKLAAIKELKEKQATLEQRRKDQDLLQKWRAQARILQERKAQEYRERQWERSRTEEKVDVIETQDEQIHRPRTPKSHKELEELRNARDRELELKIKNHIQKMLERRRKSNGSAQRAEEIEAARRDMEEVKKLQSELEERKRERDLDYRFTAFTGDNY